MKTPKSPKQEVIDDAAGSEVAEVASPTQASLENAIEASRPALDPCALVLLGSPMDGLPFTLGAQRLASVKLRLPGVE